MPIQDFNLDILKQLLNPQANPINQQNPGFGQTENYIPSMNLGSPDDELNRTMMSLLTPKDEQYDRFTKLLQMMPQKSDYPASKTRRIMAGLAGLGTASPLGISGGHPIGFRSDVPGEIKVQNSILDKPYNEAMSDWGSRAEPLLEATKLENTRNSNSRIAGSTLKSAQLREQGLQNQSDRYAQLSRDSATRAGQRDEEIAIKRQNADTADYKAKNPNKTFKDANGYLVALDPVTGVGELVKDSTGQPIETGKLDDRTKIELQLQKASQLENQRQGNRIDLEGVREENRQKDITGRAAASTKPKTETPIQRQQRIYNRAVQAVNEHPEWRPYIDIDKIRKVPDILTPSGKKAAFGGMFGGSGTPAGDPKVTQEIIKYIYGDDDPDLKAAPAAQAKPAQVTKPTIREDGKTHVKRKSDGVEGWVTDPNLSIYDLIP